MKLKKWNNLNSARHYPIKGNYHENMKKNFLCKNGL